MNLIIIRPGLLFSDTKAPAKKLINLKNRKCGILVGYGRNHLPYIHIDDVAEMISMIIEKPPRYSVYNCVPTEYLPVGKFLKKWARNQGDSLTVLNLSQPIVRFMDQLKKVLKKALGKKDGGSRVDYQILTGIRDIRYSANKAIKELGWQDYKTRSIAKTN